MKKIFLAFFLLALSVLIPVTVVYAADVPDLGSISKSLVFKKFDSGSDCDSYSYELNTINSDAITENYLRVLLSGEYNFRQVSHEVKESGNHSRYSSTTDIWKFVYTGEKNISALSSKNSYWHMMLFRFSSNLSQTTTFVITLAHGLTYPGDYKPATGSNYGDKQECPECRGSGRCKECGGSGRVNKWGGDRTYHDLTCRYCAGSGKCRDCSGSGKR